MEKIKIFIAYSREDQQIKDELLTALESIKLTGYVDTWDDSQIMIGDKWETELKKNLLSADIYLFLVSSNSIASKYVREVELKHAIDRANMGEAYLVPVIIRYCNWKDIIGSYQVLPKNSIPVTDDSIWGDINKAYLNITEELIVLVEKIKRQRYQEKNLTSPDIRNGSIEVITGCMFSGKTVELILKMKQAIFSDKSIILFKHYKDDRYSERFVVSHNREKMKAIPVKSAKEILKYVEKSDAEVIGIDEIQFFNDQLVPLCQGLANSGKKLILAGLDKDYNGIAFETVASLLGIADNVVKKKAICSECGLDAINSFRTVKKRKRELIGGSNEYTPLCRRCYSLKMSIT